MAVKRRPKISIDANPALLKHDYERAKWWRQHVVQITRETLAEHIHYQPDTIGQYESKPRNAKAFERYRNACALVHCRLMDDNGDFNWGLPQ